MFIIAIVGLVVMGIFLGYMFRGSNNYCCEHWDYDIKAGKLSALETRVFILERDNERLNHIVNQHGGLARMFKEQMYAHCYRCERTFYSRDMKDKDVAKMLNDISLTSEEIAKKLGFDIK